MPGVDRDTIKANGWALGKVFSVDSAPALCDLIPGEHKGDDQVFIAVTHDCSVISPSLKNEPYLEYLSAKKIDQDNGQFTNARNIRRLHLQVETVDGIDRYEVSMAARGFVERDAIAECAPDDRFKLSDESVSVLKRWLANRYVSQTFPDKFNQLTGHLVKDSKAPLIKAFSTDVGKVCNSIFLSLDPVDVDIPDGDSYEVLVVLLFRDEKAVEIGREAMEAFADEVKATMLPIDGLDPVEVYALAESDAAYSQIVRMSRWQLDYVSIKDDAEVLSVEHS
jgi:hypothetical protein